jgi:hypothetical protein
MSSLSGTVTSAVTWERDVATRRLCDLLDTLIAIRIDVGHSANGVAASHTLGPAQMREVRVLLDRAIASTKQMFESTYRSLIADEAKPALQSEEASPRPVATAPQLR